MNRATILFLAAMALLSLPASSTIINIPDDYDTIQEGIDAISDGDTVLVQPGTYAESINFNGQNIVLGSLFLTTDDTSYISSTIINGSYYFGKVIFEGNENSTAVITGFTIGDSATSSPGGIFCAGSSPTIRNNIIKNNYGGGICCIGGSNPVISHNIITDNTVHRTGDDVAGGGIYCSGGSNAKIINNTISNNVAYVFRYDALGGGIYSSESSPIICNNLISDNLLLVDEGVAQGGGIYCSNSSTIISNNLIIGNIASWNPYTQRSKGGGINISGGQPLINNNVIFGNSSADGSGIYCHNSGTIIMNSVIWNAVALYPPDSSVASYCNSAGLLPGQGNISTDPLFRDPDNNDFHLMSIACGDSIDSPCIDAGHPDSLDIIQDCTWGLGTVRADMGAYGGGDSVQVVIENHIEIPINFSLAQNYPNPFNASTSISFSLPEPGDVRLTVYDLLGRQVETLLDDYRPAGMHRITLDASDYSSGIYFYRVEASEMIEAKKMLLLK